MMKKINEIIIIYRSGEKRRVKQIKKEKRIMKKRLVLKNKKTRIAELKIEFEPKWAKLYNKIFGEGK